LAPRSQLLAPGSQLPAQHLTPLYAAVYIFISRTPNGRRHDTVVLLLLLVCSPRSFALSPGPSVLSRNCPELTSRATRAILTNQPYYSPCSFLGRAAGVPCPPLRPAVTSSAGTASSSGAPPGRNALSAGKTCCRRRSLAFTTSSRRRWHKATNISSARIKESARIPCLLYRWKYISTSETGRRRHAIETCLMISYNFQLYEAYR